MADLTPGSHPRVVVRPARPEDAGALATVHVAAWQGAYRGHMPDDYLDAMDVGRWTAGWTRMLTSPDLPDPQVAEVDGEVQGFVGVGPLRDEVDDADPGTGELYAMPERRYAKRLAQPSTTR